MNVRVGLLCCFFVLSVKVGFTQNIFSRNVVLNIDTLTFSSRSNSLLINGERNLTFRFTNPEPTCEVEVYPDDRFRFRKIELLSSADFRQLDSFLLINNEFYKTKIRFNSLVNNQFIALRFKIFTDSITSRIEELKLFPYTSTTASLYLSDNEIFIGEEKIFEIISNNSSNIKFSPDWVITPEFDYRISKYNEQLQLHIVPKSLGKKQFNLKLSAIKPDIPEGRMPVYDLPVQNLTFNVKSGRLAFLSPDKNEITFEDVSRREGIEVQIDKNRGLQLNKTYRIEEQEAPGGALVAELFTRQNLNNDKVLCRLRVYNLHRPTDGYLYIKDGDNAQFITNFGISPQTNINKISVLRNGVDWVEGNTVYPGEILNIRLEGEGMQKARFLFEDIEAVLQDSVVKTDNVTEFKLVIPQNISKKKIFIYNRDQSTGKFLQVREFQTPRQFDFISINYGAGNKTVEDYSGPELFEKTIKNISLSLDADKIDSNNKLFGKQYVEVGVKITGSKGELIELTTLPVITVCPGDKSPRHAYYDLKDCAKDDISLNNFISRKTYDLEDWVKITLTFKHVKDRYNGQGQEKTVEIILQRSYKFDIDVSFPSLLTKIAKEEGWQNGLGISMATIAQFSFYQKDKIARLMPYKIGAGFLALNAFNFSSDNSVARDLGIVVLGSLYPTRRDTKFSFPLYIGGGYLLNKKRLFWLFGPGIRVSF